MSSVLHLLLSTGNLRLLYHRDCLIVKLSPHVEHLYHGSCLCRTIDLHLQYLLSLDNTQSVKRL